MSFVLAGWMELFSLLAQVEDPFDRITTDVMGPPSLRRDLAILALRAYGPAGIERLEKAKVDPRVIDACRNLTPEMQAVRRKVETMKIDLNFEETKPEDVIAFLRDFSGINIIVDSRSPIDPNLTITVKENDQNLGVALKRVLSSIDRRFRLELLDGPVLLVTRQATSAPGRVPVRMAVAPANLPALVEALGSDDLESRDRATRSLRKLGFAAEPALWSALDSSSGEARARSADLLRALYSEPVPAEPDPFGAKLRKTRVTIDMQNAPLSAVCDYLREMTSLNFHFDPGSVPRPDLEAVSFRAADMPLDAILGLLLDPRDLRYVGVEGQILIGRAGRILKSPPGPFWASPEAARRMETLLAEMRSGDDERRKAAAGGFVQIGEPALGPLLEMSRTLEASSARLCIEARRRIAEEKKAWLVDDPSGVDLQVLAEPQRKRLGTLYSLRLDDAPLRPFLEGFSIKAEFRAAPDLKVNFLANDVPLGTALRIMLRPRGLDFIMDGETIVIDTAANVRERVR